MKLVETLGKEKAIEVFENDLQHLMMLGSSTYAHECATLYYEAAQLLKKGQIHKLSLIDSKIKHLIECAYWD